MLTKIRRNKHNLANAKWRKNNPNYFKDWNAKNPGYKAPGYTITKETFCHMKSRCSNPNTRQWRWYGGKGIRVEYKNLTALINDIGERPSINHSIDRIDSSQNYKPGNCRWLLKIDNVKRMRNGTY